MNRNLLYAAIGVAAGIMVARALSPKFRNLVSVEDAGRLLGLATNLVPSLTAAPRRRRTRAVAARSRPAGLKRTRNRAA